MLPGNRTIISTDINLFASLRSTIFVIVFNIMIQIFLEFSETTRIVTSILAKRLRESSIYHFLFNNLKKIIDHFCLISQLRWYSGVRNGPKMRYLMARLIQCPILVEPNPHFIFSIESNELPIDVKRSKIFVQFLEG